MARSANRRGGGGAWGGGGGGRGAPPRGGGGQRPTRARSAALRSASTSAWSTRGGGAAGRPGSEMWKDFSTPPSSARIALRRHDISQDRRSAPLMPRRGGAAARWPRSP